MSRKRDEDRRLKRARARVLKEIREQLHKTLDEYIHTREEHILAVAAIGGGFRLGVEIIVPQTEMPLEEPAVVSTPPLIVAP